MLINQSINQSINAHIPAAGSPVTNSPIPPPLRAGQVAGTLCLTHSFPEALVGGTAFVPSIATLH